VCGVREVRSPRREVSTKLYLSIKDRTMGRKRFESPPADRSAENDGSVSGIECVRRVPGSQTHGTASQYYCVLNRKKRFLQYDRIGVRTGYL